MEETAARELERLGESLSAVASDALRSIEADTAAATARVSVLLRRAWLGPLVVGLSLFLGFSGGSWATMHWLSRSIEHRIETLATVNVQIEQARKTLVEIEETTWGVTLREIDGERVVVLPAGTLDYPALDLGRAACREAVERVKALYDRARTTVDGGLGGVVPRSTRWNSCGTPSRSKPCSNKSSSRPRRAKPCGSKSSGSAGK